MAKPSNSDELARLKNELNELKKENEELLKISKYVLKVASNALKDDKIGKDIRRIMRKYYR